MIMKIASIVGARPQFIKAAPISKKIRKNHHEVLIHTGQHYNKEMSAIFFEQLGIPKPDYNLGVGSASQGKQTADMLAQIEDVLLSEKPDLTLVYGDTNSTLAGALAAVKLHIPLAHVEAGLRSFDKTMPEEVNRILTDHISDYLFCPTQTAINNLRNEGFNNIINEGKLINEFSNFRPMITNYPLVFNVGDIMYDTAIYFGKIAEDKSDILNKLNLDKKEYLLATIHRAGNTDNVKNLSEIVRAFCDCEEKLVFPLHPRTKKSLDNFGLLSDLENSKNVVLIDAVGYLDFLMLEKNAKKILTDSGGIQKEAYFFKVPCVTLRETTEWVETVEDGWNILVGSNYDNILAAVEDFWPNGSQRQVFGDGQAAEKIVMILSEGTG
ncbi:UDP-N-acetyl glucosamine 2-epimerase [Candidatus Oleimmundimicrobium sp.]|uniref:UDP-N-acetyl glucosamine 2-epimerase n=1 Tax=Candidatus Oleimmundimicrobium sp. TaxID=3060597 RepID=UPI00271FF741|nr:UDP-N-acetyl glucosamine 2-epimerase [Candidatus Oleimmundimicrobium sp.]MDO8885566.1 UDP-N-acetyl glucosamine 2-epimerase [Candidatus Oleimmundimicrobium sp.]